MTRTGRANVIAAVALAMAGALVLLPGDAVAGVEGEPPAALTTWLVVSTGVAAVLYLGLVLSVALGRGWGPRGLEPRRGFGVTEAVVLVAIVTTQVLHAAIGVILTGQAAYLAVVGGALALWLLGPWRGEAPAPVREKTLPRDLAWGAAFGVAVMLLVGAAGKVSQILLEWLSHRPDLQTVVEQMRDTSDPGQLAIGVVFVVVMAPLIEEMLYRGFLYPTLKRLRQRPSAVLRFLGHPWTAAVLSGVLFGASHGSLYAWIPLAVLGVALARLYEWNGSLAAPIAAHAAFNAIQLVGIRLMPAGGAG
jgi:membrane protease YdiL (CAAX protease family)